MRECSRCLLVSAIVMMTPPFVDRRVSINMVWECSAVATKGVSMSLAKAAV